MPALFQQTPTGYYVGGGRWNTYDEALKAAQRLQQQTGYRLYVTQHPSGQGYWVQSGRVADQARAQQLAQQWANLGLKYIRPTTTPANTQQAYQQATQNIFNQIFERVTNPQPSPYEQQFLNLIGQIQARANQPFQYDPQSDPVFQTSSRAAQRQVMEAMNERGILNSTITSDRAAQVVGELAAQFAQQAWDRYQAQTNFLQSLLTPLLTQAQFAQSFPVESLTNLLNPLINQYQYERSFPLAESEVTGRYGGQPTQQLQRDQIAAVLDLLRLLPVIPRGIGSAVPGPLGDILNRLQNTRLTLGNLLP